MPSSFIDNLHDLAVTGIDQRGTTVDDDVLIFVGQGVVGKFTRLEISGISAPTTSSKLDGRSTTTGLVFTYSRTTVSCSGVITTVCAAAKAVPARKIIAAIASESHLCLLPVSHGVTPLGPNGSACPV